MWKTSSEIETNYNTSTNQQVYSKKISQVSNQVKYFYKMQAFNSKNQTSPEEDG